MHACVCPCVFVSVSVCVCVSESVCVFGECVCVVKSKHIAVIIALLSSGLKSKRTP